MVVICGVVGVLVGFCLGNQVGRCGSGHVCYLLWWRFGGLFCRILSGGSWRFGGFSYEVEFEGVGSEHVCYLFCGWRFGGIFYMILTYFYKAKNNVGVKFVMVPNGYMVPNGNTFRIFHTHPCAGATASHRPPPTPPPCCPRKILGLVSS